MMNYCLGYSQLQLRHVLWLVFSQARWHKMKQDVSDFGKTFLEELHLKTVEENWEAVKSCIEKTIQTNIPSKMSSKRQHQAWSTRELRRKSKKKHRMYRKAKASRDPEKMVQFKEYRKQFSKDCKKTRAEYVNRRVIGGLEEGDSKPFWHFIKSLRQDNIGVPPLGRHGKLFSGPADKARILLDEFKSVFTVEDKTFIPWLGPSAPTVPPPHIQTAGVLKLLRQLKPHKAAGLDRIPNRVLKELSDELAPLLTALFNQSIKEGSLPQDWTQAFITPVYKKGNTHDASNYRPVSITSVTCKLLEHIICKHILTHMEEHNLMSCLQHGFRKGHSCETQLLLTLDDLFMSYNKKTQVDVGVLDFSRAFDTVPHERLLGKLAHYGIKGPIQQWIRAFLTDRTMWVTVDGASSPATRVLSGVPQGTVMGPLLFLIYINDLPSKVSPGTTVRLFADDCLVYRDITSEEDQLTLQKDLAALQDWAEKWGMRFNPKKCNILRISRGRPRDRFYTMCGEILQEVQEVKYLGVTISNNLKWEKHISAKTSRANSTLHFISRTLRHCPENARQLAYFTLVRSTLEYSCTVWDPHYGKDTDRLEMVNRGAARIVKGRSLRDREVSVTALLDDLKWKTLEERRKDLRLILMYKIVNGLVAVPTTPQTRLRSHTSEPPI